MAKKHKLKHWLSNGWLYVWHHGFWRRLAFIFASVILLLTGSAYGIAEWYIHKHNNEPLVLGTSFVPAYAESLGLDPEETLKAILSDLRVKQIRLVSYWKEIEKTPGQYDFSNLDKQFNLASKYGTK